LLDDSVEIDIGFINLVMSLILLDIQEEEIGQNDISASLNSMLLLSEKERKSFRIRSNKLKEKGDVGLLEDVKSSSQNYASAGLNAKSSLVQNIVVALSSGGRDYWQNNLNDGSLKKLLSEEKATQLELYQLPSKEKITIILSPKALDDPIRKHYEEGGAFMTKYGQILDDPVLLKKHQRNTRDKLNRKYNTIYSTYEQMILSDETWSTIHDLISNKRVLSNETSNGVRMIVDDNGGAASASADQQSNKRPRHVNFIIL
jgi:hypothetical protein